jgi:hypothetical protein
MNRDEKSVIIDVLLSQALADNLGDIRDAEDKLWKLIGIDTRKDADEIWDFDSAYERMAYRLKANKEMLLAEGVSLPNLDEEEEE